MPQPALPMSEAEKAAAYYRQAIAAGGVCMGRPVGTNRTSALTLVSELSGWGRAPTRDRVLKAVRAGLLDLDYPETPGWTVTPMLDLAVRGGCVLVGGDLHAWPGRPHGIWAAFCALADRLRPAAIVLNGDMVDGARISRHPRLRSRWLPSIAEEIEAAQLLVDMLPDSGERVWTWGNHDSRLDTYVANQAPELDGLVGGLQAHFPRWRTCYGATVNGSTEIRHRFRSGVHAAWNNTVNSGVTTVTGHTHQLEVKGMVDRTGKRWGIEGGMLADPAGPQFEYTEDAPRRWTPGFVLLTYDATGRLLPPETCEWRDGAAWFRGENVARPRVRVPAGRSA